MKKYKFLAVLLFAVSILVSEVKAQKADTSLTFNSHQIGFNATESLRLFQRTEGEIYELYYRYRLNSKTAIRTGLDYRLDTSGQGTLVVLTKIGFDKIFSDQGKWKFYSGADLSGGFESFSSSDRRNYSIGITPFIGAIFYLSDHFSISTEPGLLFKVKHFNNPTSFNPNNSETWVEMNLNNVGQIILSFHF